MKILIVEDNATFRQTIIGLLKSRFPTLIFEEATNRKEALQKVSDFIPDLLFMDISLSGESGLNLLREIKDAFPEIIIIILTSYDFPEYRQVAKQNGASHFLSKSSTSAEEILELVDSILCNPGSMEAGKIKGAKTEKFT
ncbi:response regulator transcription factor [bacterium]|nr:response regulator transcription factor [bacterium]